MARKIARWGIRFVVAAVLYTATAAFWIQHANGWEGLGLFIAALVFGVIAAVAWCTAIILGHFYIRHQWARLIAHPLLTVVMFAILIVIVFFGFFGDPSETAWRDAQPFAALVAGCALADAAVGFLLERWITAAPRQAS